MPKETPKPIGGEYGTVRASIDIDKLNAYLVENTPAIKIPVDVKQFKVRTLLLSHTEPYANSVLQFGQVCTSMSCPVHIH
jgi:hypothetical protein